MTEDDLEYYTRRALEERQAAERAVTDQARKSHLELADVFMRKAEAVRKVNSGRS